MRTKTIVIAVLAALAVFTTAAVALAQEGGGMRKGDFAAGVALTTSSTASKPDSGTTSTTTNTNLILTPGYYFAPEHEVGALIMAMLVKTDAGGTSSDASITFLRPFYRYHFVNVSPLLVPYLGVQVGSASIKAGSGSSSFDASGTLFGGSGGLDYFLKENVAANLDLTVEQFKISVAGANVTNNTTTVALGYKFFF